MDEMKQMADFRNLKTGEILPFPDSWSALYNHALEEGSNLTGMFTDLEFIQPPRTDPVVISDSYIQYPDGSQPPKYIEFISPSYCRVDGKEYRNHINSAHEILLPKRIKENHEPFFVSQDIPWIDQQGDESPLQVLEDYRNHVSQAAQEQLTADVRKEKASIFVTPVYFTATALGPVLSAEIWTWTGLMILIDTD